MVLDALTKSVNFVKLLGMLDVRSFAEVVDDFIARGGDLLKCSVIDELSESGERKLGDLLSVRQGK